MASTWFGEIPSCCSLTVLLGAAWVLLTCVLQAIFFGPGNKLMISCATFVTKFVFPALTFEVSHNAGGAERERREGQRRK